MPRRLERQWLNDDFHERRRRRRSVDIQEERSAKAHPGGKRVRGSGCSQDRQRKSDSVGDFFRNEDKQTDKRSIVLAHADLRKVRNEAERTGLQPMLSIDFNPGPGRPQRDPWTMFPQHVASYMMRACAAILEGDTAEATEWAEMALGAKVDIDE